MLPEITSDVKYAAPQEERREQETPVGPDPPHTIPPLEKFPIALANRISSNTRIDPVRFIWLRVRGGHFIQDLRENCTPRDLEVAGPHGPISRLGSSLIAPRTRFFAVPIRALSTTGELGQMTAC